MGRVMLSQVLRFEATYGLDGAILGIKRPANFSYIG